MGELRRALVALLTVASVLGLAPSAPAAPAAADPTLPGRLKSTQIEYDAGPAVLNVTPSNGAPQPVDLHGDLHVPAGRGPFPVVLLMHGRHGTCTYVVVEHLGHPCPTTPATTPIDSYAGYTYLARNLASHGYLVVSVDANGINTYDTAAVDSGAQARAELISRTLDLLSAWNVGPGPGDVGTALVGKVDLRRLGLMGHSRGGEGVTRWLTYNRDRADGPRYPISAVFSLAPTDFDDHVIRDTPYAVLLPRCDGDVSDLQGADVFERSQYGSTAPLHQITVEGANHNWFNSVWTGDDFGPTGDEACATESPSTVRLTAPQQERVGLAWMAAFLRRYVGGERQFDAMLSGRAPASAQCSPRMRMRCRDVSDLSYDPGPGRRTTLIRPDTSGDVASRPQTGGTLTWSGGVDVSACDPGAGSACPTQGTRNVPSRSKGAQLVVTTSGPGALTLTAGSPWRGDARGDVVVRAAVNGEEAHALGTGHARLRLQLTDTAGRTATVLVTPELGAPEPPPGDDVRNLLLSDIRVPLRRFRGVDVRSLRVLRLLLDDREISLQVADIALHAP